MQAQQPSLWSQGGGGWLIAAYRPTAPFSLRVSTSTSSGGKALLVPTPYAVKLALVDATIRAGSVSDGQTLFDLLKAQDVRFRPPRDAVVNNTFIKVWRVRELKNPPKDPVEAAVARDDLRRRPYQDTIAYREFCCFTGDLEIAISLDGLQPSDADRIELACAHVNYFGKRGSFVQFLATGREPALPDGFTVTLETWQASGGGIWGTIQPLDDLGETQAPDLFERVNTYSDKPLELLKHRRLVPTLIPYTPRASSRGYTHYRRTP